MLLFAKELAPTKGSSGITFGDAKGDFTILFNSRLKTSPVQGPCPSRAEK